MEASTADGRREGDHGPGRRHRRRRWGRHGQRKFLRAVGLFLAMLAIVAIVYLVLVASDQVTSGHR